MDHVFTFIWSFAAYMC